LPQSIIPVYYRNRELNNTNPKIQSNIQSLKCDILAFTDSIPGHPEICTLNLAILSGPEFALLEGHSRMVHCANTKKIKKISQDI